MSNNNNNNNFAYKFEEKETEYISYKIKNINENITNKYNLYKENNLYHHELIQDTISSKYKIDILPNGRINLDKDNEQLLRDLLVDTQRVTYNVLIVYNKKYFQLNNNYLTQMNVDNFEKLMYELFLEFIDIKQYGGSRERKKEEKLRRTKRQPGYRQKQLEQKREQERKQQEQERKQEQKQKQEKIIEELKNKFEKRKEKQEQNKIKQNKFISMFYLLIFQALKAEFTNYFVLKMKPPTFIFDKYQTLKTCIIDYDNYIITYYQPFLCLNKENYYITYIFSKAYFDDNNNIKIDTFTFPFNKNMNNKKLFYNLAFITNYSILKDEITKLFDGKVDKDKNIILSEDEQQMQMSFEHMNNSRTSTSNTSNTSNISNISNIYTQRYNSRSYYPQQDIENRNIFYNKIVLLNI